MQTIKNCLTCLQSKRFLQSQLTPPLQELSSLQSYPGDMLQIDLVGPFQSSAYTYVLSGIDVFTKYLFAVPLTSGHAKQVATALINIFYKHSFFPETIVSDLGTVFIASLIHELALLLEVKLKRNTLKHAQSLGVVERAHGAFKRILKLNSSNQWSDSYRYVDLACFIHNTSYYSTRGCTPSHLFHGREPVKPLDLRFKNKQLSRMEPNFDFVKNQQDALNEKYAENKENLFKIITSTEIFLIEKQMHLH